MEKSIKHIEKLIQKELSEFENNKDYYGSEKSTKNEEKIHLLLMENGWNYSEDLGFQEYAEKATDDERYKYILENIIPKLKENKMENVKSVSEFLDTPTALANREIQYGEKTGIVTKITKAGFITFDNGDSYDIEDLAMMDAYIVEESQIEEEEKNIEDLNLEEEKIEEKAIYDKESKTWEFKTIRIENPYFDETMINEVNPIDYYGIKQEDLDDYNSKNEKIEEKKSTINQPEYAYYIVKDRSKILTGWEFKEDANDQYAELKEFGEKSIEVLSRRDLKNIGLDPYEDSNWNTNIHDWDIIEEAINFGVTEGDYQEADAELYIREFKSSNKYSHVIKARLIYFLRHSQRHLIQAFSNSQVDKANNFIEKCTKTEMELMRILKSE